MEKDIDIKIVTTDEEYAQAMELRRQVFVREHNIPEELEFDGNDHSSTHVMALSKGTPVGVMRIRYFNGFVKFERMCVLPEYRKRDISEQIMRRAMEFSAQKGYDKVYAVCKKELLNRWQRDGFAKIEGVAPTVQNGMTVLPIVGYLPKTDNVITLQTDPMIINKQEGEWFDAPEVSHKQNYMQNQGNEYRLLKLNHMRELARELRAEESKPAAEGASRAPFNNDCGGKEY